MAPIISEHSEYSVLKPKESIGAFLNVEVHYVTLSWPEWPRDLRADSVEQQELC